MKCSPWDVPIRDLMLFNQEYEEFIESEMLVYQGAVERALANFWEEIND